MANSKVAVVTGGGRGIGRGIVDCFADAGYAVGIWDIKRELAESAAAEVKARGVPAIGVSCDISDPKAVSEATEAVVSNLGRPTVLVNNAGITRIGRIEDVSLQDWEATIRVNLTGVLVCTQVVGRHMLAAGSGSIVNIASGSGSVPQVYRGAYSPSKAGVILLTKLVAIEWASRGVRCNAISPGPVPTAHSEAVYRLPELADIKRRSVPLRRLGIPKEIGAAAVFLASDEASFITGIDLPVDGGLSMTRATWYNPTMGPDGEIIKPAEFA